MIQKDLFVTTINFMQERNEFETKFNDMICDEFEAGMCDLYGRHNEMLITLLAENFDYDASVIKDWIEYYIYELNFGKTWKQGCVTELVHTEQGLETVLDVPLSTPDELYAMLSKEACRYA